MCVYIRKLMQHEVKGVLFTHVLSFRLCDLFFILKGTKNNRAWFVCCVAMFLISPVFTMGLFGKPPQWADGVCREENEAGTCSVHCTHTNTRILPHFQLKPLWNKKREQQRSIGNFSTGLFWKTVHTFICWSLAFGSMQQLQWILENLYGLGNVIKPCIHLLLDCWSLIIWMCSLFDPFANRLECKEAFVFWGQKIYSVLLCACVLLSRERGNATVSPEGCLHFGPWHINENLAAGKPGVLRWVCTC